MKRYSVTNKLHVTYLASSFLATPTINKSFMIGHFSTYYESFDEHWII